MNNIISNSRWEIDEGGFPRCFGFSGPITRDNFCWKGNHTCSITLPTCCDGKACITYDQGIPTHRQESMEWGICIRAIEAQHVWLRADFYGCYDDRIATEKVDVACAITDAFDDVHACFQIPCSARYVKLSVLFEGIVTACTFCAPYAYFHPCD